MHGVLIGYLDQVRQFVVDDALQSRAWEQVAVRKHQAVIGIQGSPRGFNLVNAPEPSTSRTLVAGPGTTSRM